MFSAFKSARQASKDEQRLETIEEIIQHIHKVAAEYQTPAAQQSMDWECSVTADHLREEYVEELTKWSDAAYNGDWDALLKIAAKHPDAIGRHANATRILPVGSSIATSRPAGYTALHQAAYHNAPEEVVKALVALGCYRQLHSMDGKYQRPVDIAYEKGFLKLVPILEPPTDLLPHVTPQQLSKIQEHFMALVNEEARGTFKPNSMRVADLGLFREIGSIWMAVPGMYGGFNLKFEGSYLLTESFCRVVGGSGRTNHITADGSVLVEEGWG